MSFSWVPFYRELAGKVLEFEDRQDELLQLVYRMDKQGFPTIPLKDYQPDGSQLDLSVIEPFTFMSHLARVGAPQAVKMSAWLKKEWDLTADVPTDFGGAMKIAAVGNSWFFNSTRKRKKGDIASLWHLARAAHKQGAFQIDATLIERCLQIEKLTFKYLTKGLCWLNPQGYLPLSGQMIQFLRENNVSFQEKLLDMGNLKEYRALLSQASKINPDFVALTQIAQKIGLANDTESTIEPEEKSVPQPKNPPLNQILYGPPGTGKTYNSIRRAVEIIDGKLDDNPAARFETLRKDGQIEFVTFHQSFSYEEFIEGLRPVIGAEGGQVSYEIRAGILKEMALRATRHHKDQQPFEPSFENVWSEFVKRVESGEISTLPGRTARSLHQLIFHGETLEGENVLSGKDSRYFFTTKEKQRKAWEELPHEQEANGSSFGRLKVGSEGSNSFNSVIFNKLTEIESELRSGSIMSRFVLIIDEINRGNISKILGELITLLEDDKRIGAPNELRLTLPTSGETFSLPPNLFLLGTMNTSDKSLAQLDVALRRRFWFEEMPPRLELCDKFPAQIPVLQELNNRLEWALDREHRLGHAYFMNVESEADFNEVFRSKIVPLLLEYFPHDFQTLRAVLGEKSDGFLREMSKPTDFSGGGKKYRWWFESDVADFSAFATLQANYGV